jgi:hypothetical protein
VGLGVNSDEPSASTTAKDRAAEDARLWVVSWNSVVSTDCEDEFGGNEDEDSRIVQ